MIENLPIYVSLVFIVTTFITIGFLFYAVRQSGTQTVPAKILVAFVSFWIFFTASAGLSGFYINAAAMPPRVFLFGAFPAIVLITCYFIFFRRNFVELLPLKTLTLLSIIRIPVEFVILWLYQNGQMPQVMTFTGRNFDILSGIAAPIIFWLAFRNNTINRPLLIVWNVAGIVLLANIVITAVLAIPSPFQQIAFDQPNRAVFYFPFIWLPAIVVPIVLFSHLAGLWQLFFTEPKT
jgi:hypothetical protein